MAVMEVMFGAPQDQGHRGSIWNLKFTILPQKVIPSFEDLGVAASMWLLTLTMSMLLSPTL